MGVSNAPQGGFNLALLGSAKLGRHVSLKFVPGLAFRIEGSITLMEDGETDVILKRTEAVNLDLPLLFKIRTDRLTNFAAYA